MQCAWQETEGCYSALARSINDLGHMNVFSDFYMEHLDVIMPPLKNDLEIEAHSRLLHLMMVTFHGKRRENAASQRLQSLYHRYPKHPVVIGDYAAALMLEFRNHLLCCYEQEENVDEISRLYYENPDSEYLQTIYGKALFNQIAGYVDLKKSPRITPEGERRCNYMIECHFNTLTALCYQHPQNERLLQSHMSAIIRKTPWSVPHSVN